MRAIIRDQNHEQFIKTAEVSEPAPASQQALVRIEATSVNRGELALLKFRPDGWMPGQDFAGVVVQQAQDGSGPVAGARVVGLAEDGAWAKKIAIDSTKLTVLPQAVSFEDAATLPMAGLTALRTLRLAGSLSGKSVLITAGNGGVGFYQAQLAKIMGARAAAVVRNDTVRASLQKQHSDIHFIADTEDASGAYEVILDGVGGSTLGAAISKLAPEGTLILFGNTSSQPTPLSLLDFMPGHENARILTYFSYYKPRPIGEDLQQLVQYMEDGLLLAPDKKVVSLQDAAASIDALAQRTIHGKLVLRP